jgi:hypothetical protein
LALAATLPLEVFLERLEPPLELLLLAGLEGGDHGPDVGVDGLGGDGRRVRRKLAS